PGGEVPVRHHDGVTFDQGRVGVGVVVDPGPTAQAAVLVVEGVGQLVGERDPQGRRHGFASEEQLLERSAVDAGNVLDARLRQPVEVGVAGDELQAAEDVEVLFGLAALGRVGTGVGPQQAVELHVVEDTYGNAAGEPQPPSGADEGLDLPCRR